MSIKDRLIQFILRGKDELSPEAAKSAEALNKVRQQGEALRAELDKAKGGQGLAVSLRTTGEAAERAQTTLERSERKIERLREELDKSPDSKGLAVSLRETEREAAKTGRELDKLTAETKRLEDAARAAGIDTSKLSDEERRLAEEVARAKQAVTGNNSQLRELERQQRANARATAEHTSRVDAARQSMTSAGKTVLAFAATYISLNAAFRLVRGGINLVVEGIASVIREGSTSEQTLAQLEAALKATGGAAGYSAEQLQAMADQLESQSNFTAEQIIDAQTRLLSYTDVVGEQFPAALQISIDQAERLGISVEASAETVGKALQTPSKAMEALGRQGFKLEAGQGALLKRLEATGKMAEAQAIIMDMLNESYGGAAAAARVGTIEGLWKSLTDRVGNFYKMIGNAGALDFVKGKLVDVGDYIQQLADDGRLERLAESLSNAFIQGVEKVQEFAVSLGNIDFNTLTDDAAAWLNDFNGKIDAGVQQVQLFIAPFRTLFNGITAGLATLGATATGTWGLMLRGIEAVAGAIPDMFGGEKIQASVRSAREAMDGLRDGFVAQIQQDGADIRNAWDTTSSHAVDSQKKVADAATSASGEVRDQWDDAVDGALAATEQLRLGVLESVVAGKTAIADMAQSLDLIDTAKTVAQFEGLREALLKAYRDGAISQDEYAQSLNLVRQGIKDLGGEATASARRIEDIINALGDFNDVQKAIKGAQTDVDINKLRSAITKMYEEGALTAKEYNKAVAELEKRHEKLKVATDKQSGSQSGLAKQVQAVTEALQKQAVAAKEAADKEDQANNQRRANWSDFFGGVLTQARSALAGLSEQALNTFDAMKEINNTDLQIDTSSVESLESGLKQVNQQLGQLTLNLADGFRQQNPFARWADETLHASTQIQKTYLEQKLQLEQLMASYERGATTVSGFRSAAGGLKATLDLLDASDLQRLESAIASAKQQMDAMANSTQQTVERMRDELDQLRGDEERLERRRMASRRSELQAQLAEANVSGDKRAITNVQQALGMLAQIESEAAFAREREAREKRGPATTAQAPGQGDGQAQQQAPARVLRLESVRGDGVDVTVPDGQEDAFLSILEQAGLRTIN